MKIGLIQHKVAETKEACLEKSIAGIRKAANEGAECILLQELHAGPYFCQTADPKHFALAEPIPGPTSKRLAEIAKEYQVVLVTSLFESTNNGVYHNTAVVFDKDGSLKGKYRKMHIPDDPGYYEKYYFTPGDLGFTPIKTSIGTLGVLICWDQWFPEAARLMALQGADILLYPTAIGFAPEDTAAMQAQHLDAWMTVQRGHAIANTIPVVVCNRTGIEKDPSGQTEGIHFWGNSFIAGPQGEIITQALQDKEEVLIADIDLAKRKTIQHVWPYFRDRRIDAYEGLLKR